MKYVIIFDLETGEVIIYEPSRDGEAILVSPKPYKERNASDSDDEKIEDDEEESIH